MTKIDTLKEVGIKKDVVQLAIHSLTQGWLLSYVLQFTENVVS